MSPQQKVDSLLGIILGLYLLTGLNVEGFTTTPVPDFDQNSSPGIEDLLNRTISTSTLNDTTAMEITDSASESPVITTTTSGEGLTTTQEMQTTTTAEEPESSTTAAATPGIPTSSSQSILDITDITTTITTTDIPDLSTITELTTAATTSTNTQSTTELSMSSPILSTIGTTTTSEVRDTSFTTTATKLTTTQKLQTTLTTTEVPESSTTAKAITDMPSTSDIPSTTETTSTPAAGETTTTTTAASTAQSTTEILTSSPSLSTIERTTTDMSTIPITSTLAMEITDSASELPVITTTTSGEGHTTTQEMQTTTTAEEPESSTTEAATPGIPTSSSQSILDITDITTTITTTTDIPDLSTITELTTASTTTSTNTQSTTEFSMSSPILSTIGTTTTSEVSGTSSTATATKLTTTQDIQTTLSTTEVPESSTTAKAITDMPTTSDIPSTTETSSTTAAGETTTTTAITAAATSQSTTEILTSSPSLSTIERTTTDVSTTLITSTLAIQTTDSTTVKPTTTVIQTTTDTSRQSISTPETTTMSTTTALPPPPPPTGTYSTPITSPYECTELPHGFTNGFIEINSTAVGGFIWFHCHNGYHINETVSSVIGWCLSSGHWSINTPQCIPVDCLSPDRPLYGEVFYNTTTFNSKASIKCYEGYHLPGYPGTGEMSIGCDSSGIWTPLPPRACEKTECNPPEKPLYGDVFFNSTTFNSSAFIHCYEGYHISGVPGLETIPILCNANEVWESEYFQSCEPVDCGTPVMPNNGSAQYTSTVYNEVVYFFCDTGYTLGNGTQQAVCLASGNWSNETPSCHLIECPVPPDHANSNMLYNTTAVGGYVVYTCDNGYFINGTERNTVGWCLQSGQWSIDISEPMCKPVDCNPPEKPLYGDVFYNTTTLNSQASMKCYKGYHLTGFPYANEMSMWCNAGGIWSSMQPKTCEPIDCGQPNMPNNGGVFYNSTVLYGSANFFCDAGYSLDNGPRLAVCLASGNWSIETPSCIKVVCPPVDTLPDGSVTYENGNRTYGTGLTYTCNQGYSLIGLEQRTCQTTGSWSGDTPRCEKVKPDIKPCEKNRDTRGTIWEEAMPGRVVVLNCETYDNKTTGKISRNCTLAGLWKPPVYSCVRAEFEQAAQEINAILDNPSESGVENVLSTLSNLTSSDDEILEGEMEQATDFLETIANVSQDVKVTEKQSEDFFKTASNLLDRGHENTWTSISQNTDGVKEPRGAAKVLQVIDSYVVAVSNSLSENQTERTINTTNMELKIAKTRQGDELSDIQYTPSQENVIFLSKESLTGTNSYSAILYKDLTGIIPGRLEDDGEATVTGELSSGVLALTLIPQKRSALVTPVTLTFKHIQEKNDSYPTCTFWDFPSNAWDTTGCTVHSTEDDVTICHCDHLTNFAILMSPWSKNNIDTLAISLISYITCGLSALCLLITIGVHLFLWRYVKADRVVILLNLSVALITSYVIFLAGVKETDNKEVCTAVALLLHYIYLVVFFFMLGEGVEIAVTVLYVFVTKSRLKWILPCAWGIPVLIVTCSALITELEGYGTDSYCWLSVENQLIWAFVGPAVLIILINFTLLVLVLRAMFNTKSLSQTSNIAKTKVGVRCLCVLLPLLGCSWIIGVFYVSEDVAWLQYAFAVCNGLQGVVIFIFHVVFNEKVRMAIRARRRKYRDSVQTSKSIKDTSRSKSRADSTDLRLSGQHFETPNRFSGFNGQGAGRFTDGHSAMTWQDNMLMETAEHKRIAFPRDGALKMSNGAYMYRDRYTNRNAF